MKLLSKFRSFLGTLSYLVVVHYFLGFIWGIFFLVARRTMSITKTIDHV